MEQQSQNQPSNISLPQVVSAINRLIAAARMDIRDGCSEQAKEKNESIISRLSQMRSRMADEENLLAVKYLQEIDSIRKEINSEEAHVKEDNPEGVSQKRKAKSSGFNEPLSKQKKENAKVVPFADLPRTMRDAIMQKLCYKKFTLFDECSKFSHAMCKDTKHKFLLEAERVENMGDRWNISPQKHKPIKLTAATEQLRNVILKVYKLYAKDHITDNVCLLLMSHAKVVWLECEQRIECPLFYKLLERLTPTVLLIDKCVFPNNFPLDLSHVGVATFLNATNIDAETIVNMKKPQLLQLLGSTVNFDLNRLLEEIAKSEKSDYCITFSRTADMTPPRVNEAFQSFHYTAELTDGTTNCWKRNAGFSNSVLGVVANIESHIAAANMESLRSTSAKARESCKTRIERLTDIKTEFIEEEQKRVAEYQKKVDDLLKEHGVSTEAFEKNTPGGQKRKAPNSDLSSLDFKRSNFGFPPIPPAASLSDSTSDKILNMFHPMLGMLGIDIFGYQPRSPIGSVNFATLPNLLQSLIMETFAYRVFKTFDQCSKYSNTLSKETKNKFDLEIPDVVFQNDVWRLMPQRGRPSLATTENLRNVFLRTNKIKIKRNLTNDLCYFIMSQMTTKHFTCDGDLFCQTDVFNQLIYKLPLTYLQIYSRGDLTVIPDVSKIDVVSISTARLSDEDVRNLRPKRLLSLGGRHYTTDMIREKIEDILHGGGYETHFLSCRFALTAMTETMEIFGHRAKLIEESLNCWSVTDGKSEQPSLFVICGVLSVYLLNSSSFHSGFYSRYLKYSD